MRTTTYTAEEKLIRVIASRRGTPVELRVHYEKINVGGCDTYRLFVIEDVE